MMNAEEIQNAINTMIANGTARSRPGTLGILQQKLAAMRGVDVKTIRAEAKRQRKLDKLCAADREVAIVREAGAKQLKDEFIAKVLAGQPADAHTRGPWLIRQDSIIGAVEMDGPEEVYSLVAKVCRGAGVREANANLIVAAPDLLAAIKPCIVQLKLWMRDHGDDIASQEAIAAAKLAIAKAERRSL